MIRITPDITIDDEELEFRFVLSSGPGGQGVNKVATAVQLRFDIARSPSLPEAVRARAMRLAGRRLTRDGELVITARRHRRQERNRREAVDRLVELIRRAAARPRPRRKTRPSRAARERRLEEKRRRGARKQQRRPVRPSDD